MSERVASNAKGKALPRGVGPQAPAVQEDARAVRVGGDEPSLRRTSPRPRAASARSQAPLEPQHRPISMPGPEQLWRLAPTWLGPNWRPCAQYCADTCTPTEWKEVRLRTARAMTVHFFGGPKVNPRHRTPYPTHTARARRARRARCASWGGPHRAASSKEVGAKGEQNKKSECAMH